jgi:hypothetical protein
LLHGVHGQSANGIGQGVGGNGSVGGGHEDL